MTLQVSFMGVIAHMTGVKELALDLGAAPTLRDLLDELERRYGPELAERIYRTSTAPRLLQMCTRIFVNGDLVNDEDLDKRLKEDAGSPSEILVYILPAACGG